MCQLCLPPCSNSDDVRQTTAYFPTVLEVPEGGVGNRKSYRMASVSPAQSRSGTKMSQTKFRGTRKTKRSTRGRRLTPAEKIARAAECKHEKFRYRNRSTEAVCLACGSVQKIQGTGGNIEVVQGWALDVGEVQEHDDLCSCAMCHLKRQGKSSPMKAPEIVGFNNELFSPGAQLIAEERLRQISAEGWSAEHDDKEHERGGLVRAAMCYADSTLPNHITYIASDTWPWDEEWDKREKHSRLRKLAISGALIAAEIDRVQRKLQKNEH